MGILFSRETPLEKEWNRLQKQEEAFRRKHQEKKTGAGEFLSTKLEGKVPPKLQETLNAAFTGAFELIFEKGTGVIEKTYQKDTIEKEHQVQNYEAELKQDRKSLKAFSKKARTSGNMNTLLSGAAGIGMGVLGVGIPDIPVFTALMLKNIYEIALRYGFEYESETEKAFILMLIRGALSSGEEFCETEQKVNYFMAKERSKNLKLEKEEICRTAEVLSREMLYMKFLQGIPVAGAVGGMYDAVYMKQISEYAELKYRHRFLQRKMSESQIDGV